MSFFSKLSEAAHLAAGTVQHVIALANAGESVPQIVATEAFEIIKDAHDRIKEHHDNHVGSKS